VNEKNDIYGREKRLETLLEKIKQDKNCKENTAALLKYERDMFLGGIGVERREKVTRTLFLISKWQSLHFARMGKEDVENIVEHVERSKKSDWTKHDYKIILKKFFKWLRKSDVYPEEVRWIKIRNIGNDKLLEDMLTEEEIKRLIDHAQGPRDRALIPVLYESGCRIGELCNLKIKDVGFDGNGCVIVFPRGKTGSRRARLIFSTPFLATWIDCHPFKDPNSWLWVNVG
jgi:integrase